MALACIVSCSCFIMFCLSFQSYSGIHTPPAYNDGYNTAQQIFNTYNANKSSLLDTNTYRSSYTTDSTLYQYYPSLVASTPPQTRLYPSTSELVSPNNVLTSLPYSTIHTKLDNITLLSDNTSKEG